MIFWCRFNRTAKILRLNTFRYFHFISEENLVVGRLINALPNAGTNAKKGLRHHLSQRQKKSPNPVNPLLKPLPPDSDQRTKTVRNLNRRPSIANLIALKEMEIWLIAKRRPLCLTREARRQNNMEGVIGKRFL